MSGEASRLTLHEIQVTHRTVWRLVEVETEDGVTGVAECSDTRQAGSARRYLDAAFRRIIGHPTGTSPETLDSQLPEPPDGASDDEAFDQRLVNGALVTALCDVWAQRSGLPLGRMLGGTPIGQVPVYANINRAPRERTAEEFVAVARKAVEAGFGRIKLAPFDGPPAPGASSTLESGLEILRAVRNEINTEATILVDVHHRLPRADLEVAVREMEDLDVGWIEDAVDVHHPDQLEWLANYTSVPLAGGERLTSADDFAAISGYGFLQYILIDPKYVGSPFRYRHILEALPSEVTLTHHNPTSPISTALCAQLAMLSPNIGPLEFAFGEPVDRPALVDPEEQLRGDSLVVSPRPGIGVALQNPLEHFSPDRVRTHSWEGREL